MPMYVSETCRPDQRGRLILLEGIFGSAGLALACWVNFGFYFVHSSANWRFPIAFPAVFASFIAVVVLFLPESPRWLVMQDKLEEASKVVGLLNNVPANSEEVHRQVESIRNALNTDLQTSHSSNPFSLTKNRHLHRTVLAVVLCMITQLTGINVVTFYSNTILQTDLGFSGLAARALSGAMQLVTIVGAALGCFLIDRVNLRFLLLLSLGIMATCQWSLAGLFSIASNEAANKASIFFYFLALFGFTIGLFLGPFMYAAEIAPLSIRAKVTALAGASSWFFNFAVVEVTPIAFDSIGWKYYLVYGALSTLAILVVVLFYPDTQGRSLEEIDQIFLLSKSIFDPPRIAKELPVAGVQFEQGGEKASVAYFEVTGSSKTA